MPTPEPQTSSHDAAPREQLRWVLAKTAGSVTEIAVLAPVKKGTVPMERRTYEERLLAAIENLEDRHRRGLPTELSRIPAIHFGRLILIRPEQYLLHSNLRDVLYYPQGSRGPSGSGQVPLPIDDYVAEGDTAAAGELRTFLLTLVEFDGDLKVYMRDIAKFLGSDFDRLFENCEDYPTTAKFETFWQWLQRYQITTNLFYAPYGNLSAVRIKQLEDFKQRFDDFVARVRSPSGRHVGCLDELFDEFLRENQQRVQDFPTAGGVYKTRI
jgi:hypothetical protein